MVIVLPSRRICADAVMFYPRRYPRAPRAIGDRGSIPRTQGASARHPRLSQPLQMGCAPTRLKPPGRVLKRAWIPLSGYDELNSSHATVHGAADQAIAAAGVVVNAGPDLLTFQLNKLGVDTPVPLRYQQHVQPADAAGIIAKLQELPRRSGPGTFGFDAVGIIVLAIRNDGSEVRVVNSPPAPASTSDFHYEQMVRRVFAHYDFRFNGI